MHKEYLAASPNGLTRDEFRGALQRSLEGRELKKVLLLPPDFTRYNSNCGLVCNLYYHLLRDAGVEVDIMPAVGSHYAVTREEADIMFGDIPYEALQYHNWRTDVVRLGTVPGDYLARLSDGLWTESIDVEIDRRVLDPSYDLIISMGQVVPHEVVGMGNYTKNLFVGVGGSDMINKSHMLGAIYGLERIIGRDHTPVRDLYDYALKHFLSDRKILFVQTVCTASEGAIHTHGLFIGEDRDTFEAAVALALRTNVTFVDTGIRKCVAYLDPLEFRSTWVGNKAIYRTRKAMADGGELIILAPGVQTFGEDSVIDQLLRKYGYCGSAKVLAHLKDPACEDLRNMQSVSAHIIHSSVDGRFRITYAVARDMVEPVKGIGYNAMDIEEALRLYNPDRLSPGYQTMPDGEEIYFIPNPAIGLWINRETFER